MELPPELIDQIFALCQERTTLLRCALVCKAWLPISRTIAFRFLNVKLAYVVDQGARFVELLVARHSTLPMYVRNITVDLPSSLQWYEMKEEDMIWIEGLFQTLRDTKTGVMNLCLAMPPHDTAPGLRRMVLDTVPIITPRLEELTVSNVAIQDVPGVLALVSPTQSPVLSTLAIEFAASIPSDDGTVTVSTIPSDVELPLGITSLRLQTDTDIDLTTPILEWIAPVGTLKSLQVTHHSPRFEHARFNETLQTLARYNSIEHLFLWKSRAGVAGLNLRNLSHLRSFKFVYASNDPNGLARTCEMFSTFSRSTHPHLESIHLAVKWFVHTGLRAWESFLDKLDRGLSVCLAGGGLPPLTLGLFMRRRFAVFTVAEHGRRWLPRLSKGMCEIMVLNKDDDASVFMDDSMNKDDDASVFMDDSD